MGAQDHESHRRKEQREAEEDYIDEPSLPERTRLRYPVARLAAWMMDSVDAAPITRVSKQDMRKVKEVVLCSVRSR